MLSVTLDPSQDGGRGRNHSGGRWTHHPDPTGSPKSEQNEYSQWLAFNPRKRWGSNIFSSGCEEGSAWWEGKFRDKVGYCPFCKAYIVQHLEKFNVCFFKKPILCFNKSATFIALSLVNLISDKETIIVIIIIIRVTTTSENKFSKGEGAQFFWTTFYIITVIWELPFSNPL